MKLFYGFRALASQYKHLYKLKFGRKKVVIVHNPEDVEVCRYLLLYHALSRPVTYKQYGSFSQRRVFYFIFVISIYLFWFDVCISSIKSSFYRILSQKNMNKDFLLIHDYLTYYVTLFRHIFNRIILHMYINYCK